MAKKKKKKSRVSLLKPLLVLPAGLLVILALQMAGSMKPESALSLSSLPPESEALSLYENSGDSDFTLTRSGSESEAGTNDSAPAYDYGDNIVMDEDGVIVYRVGGKRWKGVLAVIDDPTRLFVATLQTYGYYAKTLEQYMEENDALLGVNGGGFLDINGEGNGSTPMGVVMVDGKFRWGGPGGEYDACSFAEDGTLYVGRQTGYQMQERGVLHSVSYGPALIVDGVIQEFYTPYLEPRTAVGQREDGAILLLVIEGRQVGALGVSYQEEAEIMLSLGAVNATNMDGGASSVMLHEHTMLNHCNGLAGMRTIPTAILVRRSEKEAGE